MSRITHFLFKRKDKKCKSCCLFCKYYHECTWGNPLDRRTMKRLDRLNKKLWKVERKHEKLDREYRKLVDSM